MSEHWRYLKILDDDIQKISRFIEPTEGNLSSFSLELARLLMIATQECDVLLKAICRKLGDEDSTKEGGYRMTIPPSLPSFSIVKVALDPLGLSFQPFQAWVSGDTPEWWTANNKTKLDRISHFEKANLSNVLNAVSAVLVANLYFHRDDHNRASVVHPLQHFRPELRVAQSTTIMQRSYQVPD